MEIRPMYDNTIKMSINQVKLESSKISETKQKGETIPNGIYRVIQWERIRQWFTIGISSSILTISAILFVLYKIVMNVSWIAYAIPLTLFLLSSWKLITTLLERSSLNRDVNRYREDLKIGLTSTPPFIANMYIKLYQKQVSHNWMTMFILFYGGISTLLLWWLKNVSWWIFDFKVWISNMFSNPTTMAWLFTALLITVAIIHIVFAIQRKKKILDINSYFGQNLAPASEIETIKASKNKMYRRLFIISVMVFLIIPIVVRFILKFIKRK